MKKKFILMMICILFIGISRCSRYASYYNIENADNITIFYGANSYAMNSTDKNIIKSISESLNSLSFKETDKKMDAFSMLTIDLSKDEEPLVQVSIDAQGVFCIDDTADYYEVDSGKFDYSYIEDLYEKSERNAY